MSHSIIVPFRYPDPIEYREIPGFPGYRVGNDGSVWSRRPIGGRGPLCNEYRELKPIIRNDGYKTVFPCKDGKPVRFYVHRLVLIVFVGERGDGMEACHFPDINPSNCRLENLRWGTKQDNEDDRIAAGNTGKGELSIHAKFTDEQVLEIRRRCFAGEMQKYVAADFGVGQSQISAIVRGDKWKHLPVLRTEDGRKTRWRK